MTAANPFSNRWVLLLVVAVFLLFVAELVGTDQQGGVLSQMKGSQPASSEGDVAANEAVEVIGPAPVDEVPEEDLPQVISAEQAEDTDTVQLDGDDASGEGGDIEVIEPVEDAEIVGE